MKRLYFLFFGFIACFVAMAQSTPKVVPPSPRATEFNKFGEVPVGHTTGVPDISIPLYTLVQGHIEVPVTLRYHYNGFRPGDANLSNIALGWTLQVGGNINRTVMGEPDDLAKKAPWADNVFLKMDDRVQNDYWNLRDLNSSRIYDTKYDIFTYNFNGNHGNFVLEDMGNRAFEAHNYPYRPIRITPHTVAPPLGSQYAQIDGFDLIDEQGHKYNFGFANTASTGGVLMWDGQLGEWYLNHIEAPNGIDEVTFTYSEMADYTFLGSPFYDYSVSYSDNYNYQMALVLICNVQCSGVASDTPTATVSCGGSGGGMVSLAGSSYIGIKTIKKIEADNGSIEFDLTPDNRYIKRMTVKTDGGSIIKIIDFGNDQDFVGYDRPKLRGLSIKDRSGNTVQRYSFSYDESVQVDMANYTLDLWGYCNGMTRGNNAFCEQKDVLLYTDHNCTNQAYTTTMNIGGTDMSSDFDYAKAFVLTGITYPTGGNTSFEYQGNEYLHSDRSVRQGGGLRVGKVTNIPITGPVTYKEYDYTPQLLRISIGDSYLNSYATYSLIQVAKGLFRSQRNRTVFNGWDPSLGSNAIAYKEITEYHGEADDNIGKTDYVYLSPYGSNNFSILSSIEGDLGFEVSRAVQIFRSDYGKGLLSERTHYKKTTGGYAPVEKTVYEYLISNRRSFTEKNVFKLGSFNSGYDDYHRRNRLDIDPCGNPLGYDVDIYEPYLTYVRTGGYYRSKVTDIVYRDTGNPVVTVTDYEYGDSDTFFVTKETKGTSKGNKLVSRFRYPTDMTEAPYTGMVANNIISPTIEIRALKEVDGTETLLSTLFNEHRDWGNGVFAPEFIKASKGTDSLQNRIIYEDYDPKGNPLQMKKTDGITISYIWGYNHTYPVAKIENAEYSSIPSANISDIQSKSDADSSNCITGCNEATLRSALNNLRSVPGLANALITTYTYDPLVGMTSQTDPAGITIYYEYDDFGRLENIKDKDGNIVQHNEYHYKGQ